MMQADAERQKGPARLCLSEYQNISISSIFFSNKKYIKITQKDIDNIKAFDNVYYISSNIIGENYENKRIFIQSFH